MHTLFVGVNPGIRSATVGHYYAGHSNYFWKLIYRSRIWDKPVTTFEDDTLVNAGFGFTDVCKRPTTGISGLRTEEFSDSAGHILSIVKTHRPGLVVFVSKAALRGFRQDFSIRLSYGHQGEFSPTSKVYLVPSTSGASLGDTSFRVKLHWFRNLRREIVKAESRFSRRR